MTKEEWIQRAKEYSKANYGVVDYLMEEFYEKKHENYPSDPELAIDVSMTMWE